MAEQIAKYQSENQMVEQRQKTSLGATQDGLPDKNFISTMRHVMKNPTFKTMAERLGIALMQVFIKFLRYVCYTSAGC